MADPDWWVVREFWWDLLLVFWLAVAWAGPCSWVRMYGTDRTNRTNTTDRTDRGHRAAGSRGKICS